MSKTNIQAYENEPKNYQETRKEIEDLIRKLKGCKESIAAIYNIPIIAEVEHFQKYRSDSMSDITDIIHKLGEIYGYTITDDILEGVL